MVYACRSSVTTHALVRLGALVLVLPNLVRAFSIQHQQRHSTMHAWRHHPNVPSRNPTCLRSSWNEELGKLIEREKCAALVEAMVCPTQHDSLLDTYLAGRGSVRAATRTNNTDSLSCLVLTTTSTQAQRSKKSTYPTLWVPLSSSATTSNPQLKLLSFAYAKRPISKSVCLTLNSILVNRDGGLFDNLPWSEWSIDPQLRNRDAAGNVIDPKFHLGKRDVYNRFMGKDWQGRSVSLGNLALRLKYLLEDIRDSLEEGKNQNKDERQQLLDGWQEDSADTLARRVLELQIRELQMELAEWDYQLAIARTTEPETVPEIERSKRAFQDRLADAQETLEYMMEQQQNKGAGGVIDDDPFYIKILNKIADMSTDSGKNAAPYRGAMGYAPMLDTRQDVEDGLLPYSSPYDLMKEIIGEQLNAEVIGIILENTSLLGGTLALGGAVILRRRTATKTTTIMGEELSVSNEEADFGNVGGSGGSTMLVECNADEAVGMALTYDLPIRIESQVWDRSSLVASPSSEQQETNDVREVIPLWETLDEDITFLVEGQGQSQSDTDNVSPLSIPRTTTSLFDTMFDGSQQDASSSSQGTMFPTDNPIQALSEYDALDNAGKAKMLLSLSNFDGRKLPRPRVLREAKAENEPNPLDGMLLPLVDESVRRQYLIRDAEERGDIETVEALKETRSSRQVAKEKAEQARNVGEEDVAEWWDNEADIYGNLRADVTQDEGSYSRFLDKDEWYERDRQARAKKLKKSDFGTLLDGIE